MNKVILITVALISWSCNQEKKKPLLISPKGNYQLVHDKSNVVFDNSHMPDSLNEILSFVKLEKISVVASKGGIYFIDSESNSLIKYYKLNIPELLWLRLTPNKDNKKLLVTTSTGQSTTANLFQIDLASIEIDWLAQNKGQIVSSEYSYGNDFIAIGTGYNKSDSNSDTAKFYSTLFLVNSANGDFIKYFQQGNGIEQIKLSHSDQYIYAVLGWPHVDTYVWDLSNDTDVVGVFGKDHTRFYDACCINSNSFFSIGQDGIYKWILSDPELTNQLYSQHINASSKLFNSGDDFVLLYYKNGTANPASIKWLNSDLNVVYSINLNTSFRDVVLSKSILSGVSNDNNEAVYVDINKRTIGATISLKKLREALKVKNTNEYW